MVKILTPAFLIVTLSACAASGPERADVAADVTRRSGYTLPEQTVVGEIALPPGASLEDGLTEDEAVSIALWNNAAFQEVLVNLDIARADLVQAGLLPNPIGFYSFQVPDKPLKYALEFPLEALWLRPLRVEAAEAEAERVSHQLSQAGLNLIRDTRRAYSDAVQAEALSGTIQESMALRNRIARLTQKRLAAGDISPHEANIADTDALVSEQNASRAGYDVAASIERLRAVMGIVAHNGKITLDAAPLPPCREWDVAALAEDALATRPDALAANQAISAAQSRSDLNLFGWLGITAVADATSGRDTGHELGPAVRTAVPILNQNQGAIKRADAETERAVRNQETVAQQIRLDVGQAYTQYRQACDELHLLQTKVKPATKANVGRTEKAYEAGNVAYLTVLETTRALIDNQVREAQLMGDIRRFSAELERSVGKKITAPAIAP